MHSAVRDILSLEVFVLVLILRRDWNRMFWPDTNLVISTEKSVDGNNVRRRIEALFTLSSPH